MHGQVQCSARQTLHDKKRQDALGTKEDLLSRPEVLQDHVVCWLRNLDKKPWNADATDATCGREFEAASLSTRKNQVRAGVAAAVDNLGSALVTLVLPPGEGEKFIYHYILLMAATIGAPYGHFSFDVACKFNVWKGPVDKRVAAAWDAMTSAMAAAREQELRTSFRDALDGVASEGCMPNWLQPHVVAAMDNINGVLGPGGRAPPPASKVSLLDAVNIWRGFVHLLEVYGNYDVDASAMVRTPLCLQPPRTLEHVVPCALPAPGKHTCTRTCTCV